MLKVIKRIIKILKITIALFIISQLIHYHTAKEVSELGFESRQISSRSML